MPRQRAWDEKMNELNWNKNERRKSVCFLCLIYLWKNGWRIFIKISFVKCNWHQRHQLLVVLIESTEYGATWKYHNVSVISILKMMRFIPIDKNQCFFLHFIVSDERTWLKQMFIEYKNRKNKNKMKKFHFISFSCEFSFIFLHEHWQSSTFIIIIIILHYLRRNNEVTSQTHRNDIALSRINFYFIFSSFSWNTIIYLIICNLKLFVHISKWPRA